jgi:hypothetical protein
MSRVVTSGPRFAGGRYCREVEGVSLDEAQAVLALLAAPRGSRRPAVAVSLAEPHASAGGPRGKAVGGVRRPAIEAGSPLRSSATPTLPVDPLEGRL